MSADPGDLANLADLALPLPVSFWPPAAGIWIAAAAALVALVLFGWRALQRYRADAYLRAAAAELDALAAGPKGDRSGIAEAVSAILKRAAIVAYGRERVASLTGVAWAGFIAETAPPGVETATIAAGLAKALDTRQATEAAESEPLVREAKSWLRCQRGRAAAEA